MKAIGSTFLVLAVLMMPLGVFAQQEKLQPPTAPAPPQASMEHKNEMSDMKMKRHDEMMSKMKEMDARLETKIAAMDAATGDQKVEAMAAVIKEMVAQRKEMHEQRMMCHDMGKGHMMEPKCPGMKHGNDKK